MRVLIVEDNEISAGILESNLHQRSYQTIVARTGTEALKSLETYWDIALAIVDIMVPEMDGLELVRRMREDFIWHDIPVIICSSLADSEHVAEAARLGCRHYLLKPIDRVKLLMMADKLLSGYKQIPVFGDREQIAKQYGLSPESLGTLLGTFAKLVDESIAAMISSSASDNLVPVDLAKLSESALTFGAERLLVPVQALQAKGAVGMNPSPDERNSLLMELKRIQRVLATAGLTEKEHTVNDEKPALRETIAAASDEAKPQSESLQENNI
jgi:CheY-like chemotaxis protein